MSKCICSFHSTCSVLIWFQMLRSDLRGNKKTERKGKMKKERTARVGDVKKGISHSLKG